MEEVHKKRTDQVGAATERKLHTTKIPDRYKKKNRRHHNHKAKTGESQQNQTHHYYEWKESEHPGCEWSGFFSCWIVSLEIFHVLARSANHDLEPQLTNTSHMVNTLSIGHPLICIVSEVFHRKYKVNYVPWMAMSIRRLNYIKVIIIIWKLSPRQNRICYFISDQYQFTMNQLWTWHDPGDLSSFAVAFVAPSQQYNVTHRR